MWRLGWEDKSPQKFWRLHKSILKSCWKFLSIFWEFFFLNWCSAFSLKCICGLDCERNLSHWNFISLSIHNYIYAEATERNTVSSPMIAACCWKPWASTLPLNLRISPTSSLLFISSHFLTLKLLCFLLTPYLRWASHPSLYAISPTTAASSQPPLLLSHPLFLWYIRSLRLGWKDNYSKLLSHLISLRKK